MPQTRTSLPGLDPRIHDEGHRMRALRMYAFAALPHGLHQNSGLPEFCIKLALQVR